MDDIVRQAMAKWPSVPHCYGWLALDARGNWYLRDDLAQAAGPFTLPSARQSDPKPSPLAPDIARRAAARGDRLNHSKLVEFIERNYEADDAGQWFFQNGPQRVYVELEVAPLIWRVDSSPDFAVTSHTGLIACPQRCLVDEQGRLYLQTAVGFGLVHSLDMTHAADAVVQGVWQPEEVDSTFLPGRFGFVLSPQALLHPKQ